MHCDCYGEVPGGIFAEGWALLRKLRMQKARSIVCCIVIVGFCSSSYGDEFQEQLSNQVADRFGAIKFDSFTKQLGVADILKHIHHQIADTIPVESSFLFQMVENKRLLKGNDGQMVMLHFKLGKSHQRVTDEHELLTGVVADYLKVKNILYTRSTINTVDPANCDCDLVFLRLTKRQVCGLGRAVSHIVFRR